jgi:hypothetical protein
MFQALRPDKLQPLYEFSVAGARGSAKLVGAQSTISFAHEPRLAKTYSLQPSVLTVLIFSNSKPRFLRN